jgi:dTDP-4-amino-4,6-dideoxygalactose transaminase
MIPVTKTYLPPLEEYQYYLNRIWDSGWITNNGELVVDLENKLCAYLSIPRLGLVANGTLALQLAIKALGLKGEIITTPFSYVATAAVIAWEGCTPIFVDIEENIFCINSDLIEAAITDKTSAILATHLYGYPCAVEEIARIAEKQNLKVIYDAAHCFGVTLNGQSILTYGDISTLSFHATKLFHTAEGGAVFCRDEEVARRVDLLKKFGHIGEEEYLELGINARMSELHAAMGLCVLPRVNEIIDWRRKCSLLYDDSFIGSGLKRPVPPPGLKYNYAYYPLLFPNHTSMMRVRKALMEEGIFPRRYFFPSLNTLEFLRKAGYKACPVSESAAMRVLCLPLYNGLPKDAVLSICKCINTFL